MNQEEDEHDIEPSEAFCSAGPIVDSGAWDDYTLPKWCKQQLKIAHAIAEYHLGTNYHGREKKDET